MAPKRHLGLAKAGKLKRLKTDSPVPDNQKPEVSGLPLLNSTKTNEDNANSSEPNERFENENAAEKHNISIQLSDDIDVNDAMGQLKVLWRNFIASEERNEMMVNAVIHECDRMLRKSASIQKETVDQEKIELVGDFYSIYALALSALAFFHTENPQYVKECFIEAEDRIETGKQLYPHSTTILFAEARILINKIPMTEISQLEIKSKINEVHRDASLLLDECLQKWEEAESQAIDKKEYSHFNRENSDFLDALDDLLEIVDKFGKDTMEGEDSDDETNSNEVILGKKHPLYTIRKTDKYDIWWREHTQKFLDNLSLSFQELKTADEDEEKSLIALKRELSKRLGDSYLVEAEMPTTVFTTLAYFSEGQKEIDGMSLDQAREISKLLLNKALEYLRAAEDDENPDSWASVAEAIISLGNVYDVGSQEQEKLYEEAEKILIRANNVTNGKYESILENLTQE